MGSGPILPGRLRFSILYAVAAAALFAVPAATARERLVAQPESKLWVEGTSTIKSFTCQVHDFNLAVNAEGAGAVPAVLAGQKAVRALELTVPAAKIECGYGTMNDHMRKALKADANTTIRFALTGYDVASTATGAEGTVRGSLTVGDLQRLSLMFGRIRVGDVMQVKFDLVLKN